MTNAEIAAAAHIEESTVKTHISNVLAKLGLTSRMAVIAHAYRTGVLTLKRRDARASCVSVFNRSGAGKRS